MKAILVVDIDNKYNIDDLTINYIISKKDKEKKQVVVIMPDRAKLKTMPQKKDLSFNKLHFEKGYAHGWNDCIKEILSE